MACEGALGELGDLQVGAGVVVPCGAANGEDGYGLASGSADIYCARGYACAAVLVAIGEF